jgi:hypothetical protein
MILPSSAAEAAVRDAISRLDDPRPAVGNYAPYDERLARQELREQSTGDLTLTD